MSVGFSPRQDPLRNEGIKVSLPEANKTLGNLPVLTSKSNSVRSQMMSGAKSLGNAMSSVSKDKMSATLANLFSKENMQAVGDNAFLNKAGKLGIVKMLVSVLSKSSETKTSEEAKQTDFEKTLAGWRGELKQTKGDESGIISKEGKISSLTNLLSIVKKELDRNEVGINDEGIPAKSEVGQCQILARDIQAEINKLK